MTKHFPLLLIGCAIAASACSSSGAIREPSDRIAVIDDQAGAIKVHNDQPDALTHLSAPVDKVWDAVGSTFAMLKVNRTLVNRETGEQGSPKLVWSRTFDHRSVSDYLNCGDDPFSGPNADLHPVTVSVVTRVASKGKGTDLVTVLKGTLVKPGAGSGPIYCASTGTLELHIAEMVKSRLDQ